MSGRAPILENDRGFKVRALGEIAIRCADLPKMVAFYRDIVGLELIEGNYSRHIQFFRIAPGYAGHTTVLALFHANENLADENLVSDLDSTANELHAGSTSSLHHLALTLPYGEQDAAMRWLEANDVSYRVQEFAWVGWRGIFTADPEGNTVELVAYDPASGLPPPAVADG